MADWTKGSGERTHWSSGRVRWTRIDGAVVKYDESSPWPNPAQPSARMWTAWEPDPSERALSMCRGCWRRAQDGHRFKLSFPRRWKTAETAMRAVDKEYPLQK
jgi:hypothetical protein